jgi:Tfp pilus assembly protein PilF
VSVPEVNGLDRSDSFHLSAALGWLELSNPAEAIRELDAISAPAQAHFAVLEMRWMALAEQHDWAHAREVAQEIAQSRPDRPEGWLHLAYATRRAPGGGLPSAWDILRGAAERFPKHELMLFNLGCYACQLGKLDEARRWLRRAFAAGAADKMKTMALRDEDLKPLWPEIEAM